MPGTVAIIVAAIAAGFLTRFVGLVMTVPLIGPAAWHVCRALVEPAAIERAVAGPDLPAAPQARIVPPEGSG